MVFKIYKRAFTELMKKPFRLWGVTMLAAIFTWVGYLLGGPVIGIGLGIAILLQASLANVYLKSYIGNEQIHVTDLFVTFRDWNTVKRVVCSIAWGELWKVLWLLIPIVGIVFYIIKSYEFSLIPYIVMDQPETGITDCKEVSSSMTKGYKGKMFLADILVPIAIFVVMLILGLLSGIRYIGVVFTIIRVLVYLFLILVLPLFMNIVHASFYEEIKNASMGGGQYYPVENGQYYPPQGGQYYPPQGDQYYPPQGGQYYPPQGGQYYPPQGDQIPPQGGQYYPPQDAQTAPLGGQYIPPQDGQVPPQQ